MQQETPYSHSLATDHRIMLVGKGALRAIKSNPLLKADPRDGCQVFYVTVLSLTDRKQEQQSTVYSKGIHSHQKGFGGRATAQNTPYVQDRDVSQETCFH